MNNQEIASLELSEKEEKEPKIRKRKLLTDPERMWAECRVCKETGNLENMVYLKVPFTDSQDKVLYGCYEGVYFCGEECQEKFRLEKTELSNVQK